MVEFILTELNEKASMEGSLDERIFRQPGF